jgi:hypothetical protein
LRAITGSQRAHRQPGQDVLSQAVGEVLLVGVAVGLANGSTAIAGRLPKPATGWASTPVMASSVSTSP